MFDRAANVPSGFYNAKNKNKFDETTKILIFLKKKNTAAFKKFFLFLFTLQLLNYV